MRAEISDIESLVTMRIAYIKEDLGQISEMDESKMIHELPEYFMKHLNQDIFPFIEVQDEKVVSVALLLVIEKPMSPNFINGKIGNVLSVYTMPEYRHRGLSSKVMKELMQYAKELQLDYVELLATKDGYPLYKKLGFLEQKAPYTEMRWKM